MYLAIALACLSSLQAQTIEIPVRFATPGVFSAIPVCAAEHADCHGTAALLLLNEYGQLELESCQVRAGERFKLSALDTHLDSRQQELLVVELKLDEHDPVTVTPSSLAGGCDLGAWRVPAVDPAQPLRRIRKVEVAPMGARCLRLELRGGSPKDAISGFTIPDDETPAYLCGFAYHHIESPSYGVRRLDRRVWEIDLDRLGLKRAHFRIITFTHFGAALESNVDATEFQAGVPVILALRAPQQLHSVRGTVLNAAGKPVQGARVRAFGLHENLEKVALSNGAGEFEFQDLAGGRIWISVNDENWRSRQLRSRFVEVGKQPAEALILTVDRQRWIEIDASSLELGEQVGALLSAGTEVEADRRAQPDFVVALAAKDLSKPVHIPACWGDKFRISLIPMPEEGRQHDGDLGRWIFNARVASATVGFPAGDKPAVTRYVKLKRN